MALVLMSVLQSQMRSFVKRMIVSGGSQPFCDIVALTLEDLEIHVVLSMLSNLHSDWPPKINHNFKAI